MSGTKIPYRRQSAYRITLILGLICLLPVLTSCGPSTEELAQVDYAPLPGGDWAVSSPEEEGLDPQPVAEMYYEAANLETIYALLVVKNGRLIAEDYFNGSSRPQKVLVQSVAKSYTSALVGLALEQGCLSSVEQKMVSFFPDFAPQMEDSRKRDISLKDMLQMRAGFPPEESDPELWEAVWSGDYDHLVADVPLSAAPGTAFQYSNLTTHWLGMVVARACETDLKTFGQKYLFDPLGGEIGRWRADQDGYNWAAGELHVSARDAAKFGWLYVNEGQFKGAQIMPASWVNDSLRTYSEGAYDNIGPFKDIGYGYQWWSATVGSRPVNFAWGHGGQLIVLDEAHDLVVVVTADPFYDTYGSESWKHEKAMFGLVGDFLVQLPREP